MMTTKPYPQMTIEDFLLWVEEVQNKFKGEKHKFITSVLINDENNSDTDMLIDLVTRNKCNPDYINELLPMRQYFWDFRYSQHI